MLCNERIRPGIFIEILEKVESEDGRNRKRMAKYRVIAQHSHQVIVENEYGHKRGISNAQLLQNRIVSQRMVETP